jgi:uncharacterized protein GlcG (DUF336 family)
LLRALLSQAFHSIRRGDVLEDARGVGGGTVRQDEDCAGAGVSLL